MVVGSLLKMEGGRDGGREGGMEGGALRLKVPVFGLNRHVYQFPNDSIVIFV